MIELIKMLSEFSMVSIILFLACDIFNLQSAYFVIGIAIFYYQCSSSGFLISRNFSQLCILQLACQLNRRFDITQVQADFAVIADAASDNIFVLLGNPIVKLCFVKAYSVIIIAIFTHSAANSYITILVICYSSNGVGINNTGFNLCTIFAYQCIGINYCALPCSCHYLFNKLILQACLTFFTVNGLCHGDIIGIERFDNSVKFAYGNSAHGLLALHFGIVALMYRTPASATLFPLFIISMINKRCKQFNMLAGADLYLRMS